MRLVSALFAPQLVRVPGRAPVIIGREEMRFPPRMVSVLAGLGLTGFGKALKLQLPETPPVVELADKDAATVLELYGRAGIVEVQPGESDEDAFHRAMLLRMDFCRKELSDYREQQAARRASNLEVLLPRTHHRAYLRELRALQEHLEQDDVLTAELGFSKPAAEAPSFDPMAAELSQFGLTPETVPMVGAGLDKMLDVGF